MKKQRSIVLLALAMLGFTGMVRAVPIQTIRLNIQNRESVRVEGVLVKIEDVTAAVLKNVQGDDSIGITIIVPLALDRIALKKIMDACRKAGATHFVLISKS